MKMILGLNVLNEAGFIEKCISEIIEAASNIVIVDGAYELFPYHGDNGASDDGTLEIVKSFPDPEKKVVLVESTGPWKEEITKLNVFLSYGEEGAWMFRIDSDERITGSMEEAKKEIEQAPENVAGFMVRLEETGGNMYKFLRIVRWRPDLRYGVNHCTLFYGDLELKVQDLRDAFFPAKIGNHEIRILESMMLKHEEHDEEREKMKRLYYSTPGFR